MKIIIRSYDRENTILDNTLGELLKQKDIDLAECLYIYVGNQEQYDKYSKVLKDYPLKEICIRSELPANVPFNDAIKRFPEGDKLVFIDDDLYKFRIYEEIDMVKKKFTDCENLGEILNYCFDKVDKNIGGVVNIYFAPNLKFKQGSAFYEYKPRKTGSSFWGMYNDKELLVNYSHNDDDMRTAMILEKYSGMYNLNWFTAETKAGVTKGGMTSAGDRDFENQKEFTKQVCEEMFSNEPLIKKYFSRYRYKETMNMHFLDLKNIRELRKIIPNCQEIKWSSYMQESPDIKNYSSLF
jgi:hypothetical protein